MNYLTRLITIILTMLLGYYLSYYITFLDIPYYPIISIIGFTLYLTSTLGTCYLIILFIFNFNKRDGLY